MNSQINQRSVGTTITRNGAITLATSGKSIVDLFSRAGAMRKASEQDILSLFTSAFEENPLLAVKSLFHIRDAREGVGERRTFKICLKWLGNNAPGFISKNIHLVSFYGRADDIFCLFGTKSEEILVNYIQEVWNQDISTEKPSLALKWFPSTNASSKETITLGHKVRKVLHLSAPEYRKTLSKVRAKIGIVESEMTRQEWGGIDYSKVPSVAGFRYRKAFRKHDEGRYSAFMEKAKTGEVKINTAVLYPYDIISKIMGRRMTKVETRYYTEINQLSSSDKSDIDTYWKNLPDYLDGEEYNAICVVDVSGSMKGSPICAALSLGIYFAERNKGAFNNKFITFSEDPQLQTIKGDDIYEKVVNLNSSEWGQSTNLQSVFEVILKNGQKKNVPAKEMPREIIIVSDMQLDQACSSNKNTNFEAIREKYEASGYSMPSLTFWNVNAIQKDSPVEFNQNGVKLVSGYSANSFKTIMNAEIQTPLDLVLSVIESERYEKVTI